jgi:hypothetical protein
MKNAFTPRVAVLTSRPIKTNREDTFMKHLSTLAIGLLIGTAAFQFSNSASGQSEGGWVTLLDSTKMGDWDEVGKANWAMKDGALTADKLTEGKDPAYLVTKSPYKDFQIRAEFWVSDDANSGIFIRCEDPKKIGGKTCYEVNIYDQRPDPSYGTGAIVDVAKVDPIRDHGARPAFCRRAQWSKDRRCTGLETPERRNRAAIRFGCGQIPQGANQAAVELSGCSIATTLTQPGTSLLRCEQAHPIFCG